MRYKTVGQLKCRPDWWLTLQVDEDLGAYYRRWFNLASRYDGKQIGSGSWGSHISIVRGEEPDYWKRWEEVDGVAIEFEYETIYKTEGKHIWFPVFCDRLPKVREFLGLEKEPFINFHLTIGVYHKNNDDDLSILSIPKMLE
jgi:hypothetical protein